MSLHKHEHWLVHCIHLYIFISFVVDSFFFLSPSLCHASTISILQHYVDDMASAISILSLSVSSCGSPASGSTTVASIDFPYAAP